MAAFTNVLKAIELLNALQVGQGGLDPLARRTEKMTCCTTIVNGMSSPLVKTTKNYAQVLGLSIKILLSLCDDEESDVRMIADECLNRIIRSTSDGNVLKIQFELYNEIHRNASSRSLRAALKRFGLLSHTIRPIKGKAYISNLIPSIVAISKRPEEEVIDTLAQSLPLILKTLGPFMTDKDAKVLLKAFYPNLSSPQAVFRRNAGNMILATCLHCRKPRIFLFYALRHLIDTMISVNRVDENLHLVVGILGCIRIMLPHVDQSQETDHETDAHKLDCLIQVYELSLRYIQCHSDHNVVNAALETLVQLLRSPNDEFVGQLTSKSGISGGSRIVSFQRTLRMSSSDSTETEETKKERCAAIDADSGIVTLDLNNTKESIHCHDLSNKSSSDSQSSNEGKIRETTKLSIGSSSDVDVPLKYCCRYLSASFLLAGRPNELISDKQFRVSVKSLTLTCIGGIIRLYPNVLLHTLENCPGPHPQMISDILLFSKHPDPQLRGNVAVIIGLFLNSVFVKYWGSYKSLELDIQQTEGKIIELANLVDLLINSLEDESATTCRQALQSLEICLTSLLQSEESHQSLRMLFKLLPLSDNPYFLVKMNLSKVLSELPFITIKYLTTSSSFQTDVTLILVKLLGDQDPRVRNAVSKALVKFIATSYYQSPHEDEFTRRTSQYIEQYLNPLITINVDARTYQLDQKFFVNSLVEPFLSFYTELRRPNIIRDNSEDSLSIIVALLVENLFTHPSRHLSYGCFEALSNLSQSYPTTLYPDAWDCRLAKGLIKKTTKIHSSNKSITSECNIDFPSGTDHLSPTGIQLLSLTISLLSSDAVALDLLTHKHMITLAGNLMCGISLRNLKSIDLTEKNDNISKMWGLFEDKETNRHLELLFLHVMRLINIFVHVIDGLQVASASGKSGLPSLPTAQSLSPRKRMNQEYKPRERKENVLTNSFRAAKEPIGAFSNLPHYMRLHDILKAAHMNYMSALDVDASQMYLGLLDSTLQVLSQILDVASTFEARKIAEEVLHYLETTLALSPTKTVQCVRQLLKSLFGTNLSARWDELEDLRSPDDRLKNPDDSRRGLYDRCFQKPGRQMADVIKSIGNNSWSNENELKRSSSSSSFNRRDSERKMVLAFKSFARTSNQKAFFVSFIRIFETMVIKSLNQYTTTSSVSCQCQVLSLLSQLVQFHVNYCLLDTDKTFIDFVLGQFPFIEESQISQVQLLLPKIFGFLVHLSYEKFHSKMIIDIREIIKLCDGLMASGQPPTTHCIPALVPVVEDIFLARSSASKTPGEKAELDTTREYLMSMLLRLVEHHTVIELLSQCLSECRSDEDGEEKWRKWSRMTIDAVLPALVSGKIRIESESAGVAVIKLFSNVSPSCFRPVDPLLKILFTVPPGLNESRIKLERWLGMVNIVLLSLIAYAKEEAMLSRLAELSVFMTELVHTLDLPDTFTIYDTADPLNATNIESCSLPPERIIAIFVFRVIFLASSKICLTLNSVEHRDNLLHNRQGIYLLQELAFFLQLCIHMFESGSHCKVANATIQMLNDEDLIPIEKLNSLMLEISVKNCPILTTHWTYLMTLLGYSSQKFWSKTLGSKNRNLFPRKEEKTINIDTKIVRQSATILFCDHICENMNDTESLTWLVMNHIEETMNLVNEPPVRELGTATVHRKPAASGLLIQAIAARCLDLSKPSFVKKLLKTLESAHEAQSGAVILALIPRFISLIHLALAKTASRIACKRVEFLLSLPEEEVLRQLPKEDLLKLMEILQSARLVKKHGVLVGLINNLASRFYDISPLELEHCRPFNPSTVQNILLDRSWFLSQVRLKCCKPTSNSPDSSEAAELLSNLDLEDCDDIFMSKNFDLRILTECIKLGMRLTHEENTRRTAFVRTTDFTIPNHQVSPDDKNSECLSFLYQSSRQCLLIHVKSIIDLLPKPHIVYDPWVKVPKHEDTKRTRTTKYSSKFRALMEDQMYWDRVFTLIPAVTAYLEALREFNTRGIVCNTPRFDEEDLSKFAVLCLEIIHWMTFTRSVKPQELELALTCATELLKNERISKIFGSESHYTWVCSASNTLTKLLEYWLSPKDSFEFSLPRVEDRGLSQALRTDSTRFYAQACLQMAGLIAWLEKTDNSSRNNAVDIPSFIKDPVTSLIIIISRHDLVNSFVLTPPLVWKHGWMIEGSGPTLCHFPLLLSTADSNFLQELDVLRQFVYRITLLGWTSRLQFEEIWMALLSVLSAASTENESPGQSEGSSVQSTTLAVQGITRLLTQTLMLPHPGNPVNSIAMHHCRDPPLSLQKPASQRLYTVQDLLSWKYQYSRNSRITKDSFVNSGVDSLGLEHLFTRGNIEREGLTTGFDELSYSQLSVSYLWASCSLHEDKLSASVLMLKETRNQALSSNCLDLDSCIRFLIELYTRWLAPSSGSTLRLLNEVVRSIISISDLFVERGQFQWMFDTCSEIVKYHTIDDDILHHTLVFAVCKSAAVLAPLDIESLEKVKRAVENGLRTSYLPGRIASLHGILFLLQCAVQANCEETMNVVHPLAIKYIHKHIEGRGNVEDHSEEHQRTMWALVFFLLEHAEDTPPDSEAPAVLELALALVTSGNISIAMNRTILQGLERLVAAKSVVGRVADQIVKVSLERLKNSCPLVAIPALRLLLTCMYSEAADRFNRTAIVKEEQPLPDIEPEALMRTIERTSAIFDRIKRGQSMEVKILCAVLSEILGDFFPPFETLTKVIGEFLAPQQPHQRLVSGVVFKVCERVTGTDDQLTLLQDWVVFSLSTFIQSLPLVTSTWCLSCFFVSASTNKWLRALFPHVQSRMGKYEYEDKKIMCIAAADFYKKLSSESQREAFLKSFEAAGKEPGSPFCDIITTFKY